MGTTRRRGREGTDRWFVSQHSLPAQQERDSQAKVVGLVRRASTFGLRLGPWSVDMAGVRRRKRELVNGMIAIHKAQFAANGREFILRGSLRWAQDDRSSAHARWPPMRSAFRPMTLSS